MTVNVSKPVVNVREKLAELDKPTGIAGEAMLRAETPQEQFNLIGAGRRNLIINGAMRVAQRATSSKTTTVSASALAASCAATLAAAALATTIAATALTRHHTQLPFEMAGASAH